MSENLLEPKCPYSKNEISVTGHAYFYSQLIQILNFKLKFSRKFEIFLGRFCIEIIGIFSHFRTDETKNLEYLKKSDFFECNLLTLRNTIFVT